MEVKIENDELEKDTEEMVNKIVAEVTAEKEMEKRQNESNKKDEIKNEKKENEQNIKKYNNYEKNVEEKNKNRKRIVITTVVVIIAIILISIFCTIFALINTTNNKILEGIFIKNIDVSGLTKEEAKNKIEKICNEKIQKEVNVKYNEYESTITFSAFEVKYKINEAVESAYNIGRNGNIIQNNFRILNLNNEKEKIDTVVTMNEEEAVKMINNISANIPGYVVEASYYIENDNLIITKGQKGLVVDNEEFLKRIYDDLKSFEINQGYIEIPVIEADPKEIDIEKIYKEVYKEAKDAYYTKEPFEIFPEVNGIDFDIEEAKEILKEDKEEYVIQLNITKPQKTTRDIGTEAFPDLLGTCSTKYNVSQTNRTTNLRLAANKVNETVLLPGEEFSYNKVVGKRTIAAGYKEAAIFSAGQVVDGLGGGICQISSTIYDAAVYANLEITQRRNHQFVTSYLPAGLDATVVWGSQDFKFKNNRKYPIRIVATVSGGIAKVDIFGKEEENEYEISMETRQISTIYPTTVYNEDSTKPVGYEAVTQAGTNGRVVEVYKVVKQDGNVISKTLLSKDTYNAKQRIVVRGTGAEQSNEASAEVTVE